METIYEPNNNFDYSKLSLGQPQSLQGGSYFTKILFNNKTLYCQFPRCKTKQGIVQTDKKIYLDLLYDTNIHNELSNWLENLETECQRLIFEKRQLWFQNELELSEIESAFNTCSKMYKSGKQYLIRCYINKPSTLKLNNYCIIYDENEVSLSMNNVDITKEIIPLLKIEGIKFTNKNFQIELQISQIMVMNDIEEPKTCLIKPKKNIQEQHLQSQTYSNNQEINIPNTNTNINTRDNISLYISSNFNEKNKDTTLENSLKTNLENNSLILSTSETLIENDLDNNEYDNHKDNIDETETETENENSEKNSEENSENEDEHNSLDIHNNKNSKQDKDLELIQLNFDDIQDTVVLRKRNEVYYDIYKKAREKAKKAKKEAIEAYLEAKNIKSRYMLNDLDESDEDELNFDN
jgi:hypothetical protein